MHVFEWSLWFLPLISDLNQSQMINNIVQLEWDILVQTETPIRIRTMMSLMYNLLYKGGILTMYTELHSNEHFVKLSPCVIVP